ncbi:MAG: universal stress protein [Thiobacillaceae bacterium]
MKTYRRILVPISNDGQGDILLHRAADLAQAQRTQMLVVRVLDTRSGFEPDGPAASLPGESAARRAPAAMKRLDLQLTRNNLAWAEAKVVWGEPKVVLADLIRQWQPDLVVACTGTLPQGIAEDADILNVGCQRWFKRLTEAFHLPAPKHA